jgi:hypothetical protein
MSAFTDWLRSHLQDYSQLVEKGSPLNNQYQQLKSNVSQNVPPTAAFRNPQQMQDWSMSAALNAPGIGAIKAWHGSPHKFTQFDDSSIGSGEGAQAFGMGHYSGEDVAALDSHYRKRLSDRSITPDKGFMYELNLKPDTEDLLHFDKKLSEHPKEIQDKIQEAISKANGFKGKYLHPNLTGQDMYNRLTAASEGPDNARDILLDVGIPGHSFTGQGGKGKPNYVMYDPKQIEIKRRIRGGLDSPVKGFVDYIKGKKD